MTSVLLVLNCSGSLFSRDWDTLYSSLQTSDPWYESPLVPVMIDRWGNRSEDGCNDLPEAILDHRGFRTISGFCALGYAVSLYAQFLSGGNQSSLRSAVRCAFGGDSWWAWSLLVESRWGQLLHPWALLDAHRPWSEDTLLAAAPQTLINGSAMDRYSVAYLPQLYASMEVLFPAASLSWRHSGISDHSLSIVAFGVHAPTLLEPVFAFHRLRAPSSVTEAVFYGTSHPPIQLLFPEVCPPTNPNVRCLVSSTPPDDYWRWVDDRPELSVSINSLLSVLSVDRVFQRANLIVCGGGHSPTLCILLRMVTEKPMYFTLQAPLAFRMPKGEDIRMSLIGLFRSMAGSGNGAQQQNTVISTSLFFLQRQIWAQFGRLLPVVTNHNLYLPKAHRKHGADEVIFWQNHVSLTGDCSIGMFRLLKNLCPAEFPLRLVFKNLARMPGYRIWRRVYALNGMESMLTYSAMVSRFVASVLFPHDIGMISFDDLYRLNIPIFMPTTMMVATMAYARLESSRNYPWYLLREELVLLPVVATERYAPPWVLGGPALPDDDLGADRDLYLGSDLVRVRKLARLLETSNFALFPHVTTFQSMGDLLVKLQEADLISLSKKMKEFCEQGWKATSHFYRRAGALLRLPLG